MVHESHLLIITEDLENIDLVAFDCLGNVLQFENYFQNNTKAHGIKWQKHFEQTITFAIQGYSVDTLEKIKNIYYFNENSLDDVEITEI